MTGVSVFLTTRDGTSGSFYNRQLGNTKKQAFLLKKNASVTGIVICLPKTKALP